MVGLAARRQSSFQLWLHTQSNAKQPSPSVLRPSHCSVESAKAGEGARCRAQLIGPSKVREPDAHHPGRVPRCPPEFLGALRSSSVPSRHLSVLMGCQCLASGPVDRCSVGPCTMLSWIVLCAGRCAIRRCAIRQYVAWLMSVRSQADASRGGEEWG